MPSRFLLLLLLALPIPGCSDDIPEGVEMTPPTGLTLTPVCSPSSALRLTWSPAPGAETYTAYYRTVAGVTPDFGTAVEGLTTSPVDFTGLDLTTYYFILTSVLRAGPFTLESDPSAEVSATNSGC